MLSCEAASHLAPLVSRLEKLCGDLLQVGARAGSEGRAEEKEEQPADVEGGGDRLKSAGGIKQRAQKGTGMGSFTDSSIFQV